MIHLTFPDNSVREFRRRRHRPRRSPRASPSRSPRRRWRWRSTASSPTSPTRSTRTRRIEIVTRDDPRALELIRHDAAHVMAEAVQELYPGTQVTIGPVIENGFYYDFFRNEPFTTDDLPKIEAKMREIVQRNRAVHQGSLVARRREAGVRRQGRDVQGRAGRRDSRRTSRSRSTSRATGSTSAAGRTWPRPARSATPSS